MKNKLTLAIIVSAIIIAVFVVVIFVMDRSNSSRFDDYVETGEEHIPFITDVDGTMYVNDHVDTDDEYMNVIVKFAEHGYTGGVIKEDVASLGEVDPPKLALEYEASYWYTIITLDSIHHAIIADGEIIIE